jgi:hypothetical protein
MGESALTDLSTLPLTFFVTSSVTTSYISSVSSVETTPVCRLRCHMRVSGVKYSDTNFPFEISVPFKTNSQSLFTERVLLISSCTCWQKALWAPVVAGAWSRHTLLCRWPTHTFGDPQHNLNCTLLPLQKKKPTVNPIFHPPFKIPPTSSLSSLYSFRFVVHPPQDYQNPPGIMDYLRQKESTNTHVWGPWSFTSHPVIPSVESPTGVTPTFKKIRNRKHLSEVKMSDIRKKWKDYKPGVWLCTTAFFFDKVCWIWSSFSRVYRNTQTQTHPVSVTV